MDGWELENTPAAAGRRVDAGMVARAVARRSHKKKTNARRATRRIRRRESHSLLLSFACWRYVCGRILVFMPAELTYTTRLM